jgi:hypothetical protein
MRNPKKPGKGPSKSPSGAKPTASSKKVSDCPCLCNYCHMHLPVCSAHTKPSTLNCTARTQAKPMETDQAPATTSAVSPCLTKSYHVACMCEKPFTQICSQQTYSQPTQNPGLVAHRFGGQESIPWLKMRS